MAEDEQKQGQKAWFLRSSIPVLFPQHAALSLSSDEFDAFLQRDLANHNAGPREEAPAGDDGIAATKTTDLIIVDTPPSWATPVSEARTWPDPVLPPGDDAAQAGSIEAALPLAVGQTAEGGHLVVLDGGPDMTNKRFTDNGDIAYQSSKDPLVDLFSELSDAVSGPRLVLLLDEAWACDSLATLKIIFNARSIHLGKSSRMAFYRGAGWLAQSHPLTLLSNLRWLSRPVIDKKPAVTQKRAENAAAASSEAVVVVESREADEAHPAHYDVRDGGAHGYWKDLLNLLALAANGALSPLSSPRDLLNLDGRKAESFKSSDSAASKAERHVTRERRHANAVRLFETEAPYRALHLTVARLFAEQLRADLAALRGSDKAAKRQISLCGKWAPSSDRFHDKHTFVVSSIAEVLHPASEFGPDVSAAGGGREVYLRHAREAYRKDLSALRAHLHVVERDISAGTFADIDYERLPSLAMKNYGPQFVLKDEARFEEYLAEVALGKARISGATLMPSTLVREVKPGRDERPGLDARVRKKMQSVRDRVADGQWKTLVQRIRDSGTLPSTIAVCDVSGSMGYPVFADKTCPMDSAIGLSLLMAEVAEPPFGGVLISFSEEPRLHRIDMSLGLRAKVDKVKEMDWGMNTDFVAVFERLLLPMAREKQLRQEDMVKRIFVFSDMQFDQAQQSEEQWSTSYERIQKQYREAGYEMPELVFWNLAGGRGHCGSQETETGTQPVTVDNPGTALVSGYSQAMLKVFLEGGSFEDPEEADEHVIDVDIDEDGISAVEVRKKPKLDPLALVKKAISHKAYAMLKVVD